MNRNDKIQSIAAKLKHNIEAMESMRPILAEKYNKGEKESIGYKALSKNFDRAENNKHRLMHELGELDARFNTTTGEVEIY